MIKLSNAQTKVLKDAQIHIDFARTHTFYDWVRKTTPSGFDFLTDEQIDKEFARRESEGWNDSKAKRIKEYENEKSGITLTYCNSRTLEKLQELGLIKIIYDSNGEKFGIDRIKLLNY